MHKVATLTYKTHILKRAAAAVANHNISKAEFERVVLQMSKADTELLIADLRQGSAPDPRKFFHIAKHLAGLAQKSPLVHGIVNDEDVTVSQEQLLDNHIKSLYCDYNKISQRATLKTVIAFEHQINAELGKFTVNR